METLINPEFFTFDFFSPRPSVQDIQLLITLFWMGVEMVDWLVVDGVRGDGLLTVLSSADIRFI